MAVAGREQQNLKSVRKSEGKCRVPPDKSCKPSKWYPIYGIRLVLAARRVIPKTVDRVTGMQFFHSGQSFQIS